MFENIPIDVTLCFYVLVYSINNIFVVFTIFLIVFSAPGGLAMLKGYAFIEYFRKKDCDKALKGTQGIKLGNQEIEIRISGMYYYI